MPARPSLTNRKSFAVLAAMGQICACEASTTIDLLPVEPDARQHQSDAGSAEDAADATSSPNARSRVTAPLLHRYDFSGSGTVLRDLVGDANGSIRGGASLDGGGTLTLDGIDDYVLLPGGLISSHESVTLVTWFTWLGDEDGVPAAWHRVFDFGATSEGGEQSGTAVALFFFTPLYVPGPGDSANFTVIGDRMVSVDGAEPFPIELEQQIAVVFNGEAGTLESYVNGVSEGRSTTSLRLSDLPDQNCWLGQSQWSHDAMMHGSYNEFRIYGAALTRDEIRVLLASGPEVP